MRSSRRGQWSDVILAHTHQYSTRLASSFYSFSHSSDEKEPCAQTYDDLSEDDDVTGFEDSEEEDVVIEPPRTRARVAIVPPVDALEIVEAEPVRLVRRSSRRSNTAL